jgi:PilZ domain
MAASESSTATRIRTRSVIVEPPADVPDGRDRRQHTRHPLTRPAKLFCPDSGRFLSGQTRNISAGGVLVEVEAPDSLCSGDDIQLTIAFGDRFIVPMSELVAGSVIRTIASDDPTRTCLAIAYDNATETTPQG